MQEGKIIFRNCEDSEEERLLLNPEAAKTELEQKAEEYVESKGKEHFRKFYDKQLSMADLLKTCCMEFATETTKELVAENELLKKGNEIYYKNWQKQKNIAMKTSAVSNKAKEVLEGLMRFCRCFAQHHTEDIRYKEAEQFLKRCE